jgi:hypothetical protein
MLVLYQDRVAEVGAFGFLKKAVKSVGKAAKGVVKGAAKVSSYVPGVGTGVSAGLRAATAVAEGKSLKNIAREAALGAVPGGQLTRIGAKSARQIARGGNVAQVVRKAATGAALKRIQDIRSRLQQQATVASFVPGVGTATSVGLRAAAAASAGKNLRTIGEEAALGAVPGGHLARAGVKTAIKVGRGQNVLRSVGQGAIEYGESQLGGGPVIQRALAAAKGIARGQNVARTVAREGLAYAQSRIPVGLSRQAFEAATKIAKGQNVVRTIGQGAIQVAQQRLPGGELTRRATSVGISAARGQNLLRAAGQQAAQYARSRVPTAITRQVKPAVGTAKSIIPRGTMTMINQARPSYGQPPSVSPENIRRLVNTVSPRRPQLGPLRVSKSASAAFRPLSMATRAMLVRALPHMRGEVSGLSETGVEWLVESGDTGSKIAQKLTGNANRWTELRAVNPTIMSRSAASIKKYGFPIYVGDKVKLPSSWIQVTAKPPAVSAPAASSQQTAPPVQMPGGDIAAQGQARTILAAWGRSDGANQAGVVRDYGGQSELFATAWSGRDVLQGGAFSDWWKVNGGVSNLNNGYWSDELARALNTWAERKAAQVTNTAMAGGGIVIPSLTGTPVTPVPEAVPPTQPTPVSAPPGSTPTMTLPTLVVGGTPIALPPIAGSGTPTAVATGPARADKPAEGLSDNQKWAFGSVVGGSVASALIRALWA